MRHHHAMARKEVVLFVCAILFGIAQSYLPVVIMHGILDSADSMQPLVDMITAAHPGTNATSINVDNHLDSIKRMSDQVSDIIQILQALPDEYANGYHCIGFSQGTLGLRGVIETWSDHRCVTFLTLSGPLMGQYGLTAFFQWLFPNLTTPLAYKFFYSSVGQDTSVGGYWKDPTQIADYLAENQFLPVLNNETNNGNSEMYKMNFLKLKQVVNIGGPDDGVITPWESALWGFYDENLNIVPMEEQPVYTNDWFGLRTIAQQGLLVQCTFAGFVSECLTTPAVLMKRKRPANTEEEEEEESNNISGYAKNKRFLENAVSLLRTPFEPDFTPSELPLSVIRSVVKKSNDTLRAELLEHFGQRFQKVVLDSLEELAEIKRSEDREKLDEETSKIAEDIRDLEQRLKEAEFKRSLLRRLVGATTALPISDLNDSTISEQSTFSMELRTTRELISSLYTKLRDHPELLDETPTAAVASGTRANKPTEHTSPTFVAVHKMLERSVGGSSELDEAVQQEQDDHGGSSRRKKRKTGGKNH